jgi:hypothetical protein
MKSPFNLRCRIYQWLISVKIAGNEPLGKATQRHINSCAECKTLFEEEITLTSRLRHEAPKNRTIPPASLHFRIMAAVHQEQRTPLPTPQPMPHWGRKLLPIMGMALVVLFGFVLFRPTPISQVTRENSASASASTWEKSVDSFARNLDIAHGSTALEWTEKMENSLDQEMKSLVKDAKTAVTSLAQNFLPTHTQITLGRGTIP